MRHQKQQPKNTAPQATTVALPNRCRSNKSSSSFETNSLQQDDSKMYRKTTQAPRSTQAKFERKARAAQRQREGPSLKVPCTSASNKTTNMHTLNIQENSIGFATQPQKPAQDFVARAFTASMQYKMRTGKKTPLVSKLSVGTCTCYVTCITYAVRATDRWQFNAQVHECAAHT